MPKTSKPVRFEVSQHFDVPLAWAIQDKIKALPEGTEVDIDFSRARDISDFALAVFSQWLLTASQRPFHLLGLRGHQDRLLRYFGVGPDRSLRAFFSDEASAVN